MNPSDTPPSGDDPGVLSGLSRTRPQRRSNKRPGRQTTTPDAAAPAEQQAPAAAAPRASRKKTSTTSTKRPSAGKRPAKAATMTAPDPPAVEVGRVAQPRAGHPAAAQQHTAGVDLVGQAIQAAGEVAQLGVGIGRQVAKGILSRLPKP